MTLHCVSGKDKLTCGDLIECYHSRDPQPYWFAKTKDNFCIKREFYFWRNGLVHQYRLCFFILEH